MCSLCCVVCESVFHSSTPDSKSRIRPADLLHRRNDFSTHRTDGVKFEFRMRRWLCESATRSDYVSSVTEWVVKKHKEETENRLKYTFSTTGWEMSSTRRVLFFLSSRSCNFFLFSPFHTDFGGEKLTRKSVIRVCVCAYVRHLSLHDPIRHQSGMSREKRDVREEEVWRKGIMSENGMRRRKQMSIDHEAVTNLFFFSTRPIDTRLWTENCVIESQGRQDRTLSLHTYFDSFFLLPFHLISLIAHLLSLPLFRSVSLNCTGEPTLFNG